MPAPGARPDCDKIHCNTGQKPPVICGLYGAPELIEAQPAQGQPDKEDADQNSKPKMPFLHASIVPEAARWPAQPGWLYGYNFVVQVNQPAPDFELPDLNGKATRLSDLRGKIVVVNFWSCECPHSERTDHAMMAMFVQWRDDVILLPVASNRIETVDALTEAATTRHLPTVLLDSDHQVADLYGAQSTPHVFVIDREGILRYCGAVDDVAFRQKRPTRFYLDEAVEALLDGHLPPLAETQAYGCSIIREAVE